MSIGNLVGRIALGGMVVAGLLSLSASSAQAQCRSSSECKGARVCRDGRCVSAPAGCTTDAQCPGANVCERGVCVAPTHTADPVPPRATSRTFAPSRELDVNQVPNEYRYLRNVMSRAHLEKAWMDYVLARNAYRETLRGMPDNDSPGFPTFPEWASLIWATSSEKANTYWRNYMSERERQRQKSPTHSRRAENLLLAEFPIFKDYVRKEFEGLRQDGAYTMIAGAVFFAAGFILGPSLLFTNLHEDEWGRMEPPYGQFAAGGALWGIFGAGGFVLLCTGGGVYGVANKRMKAMDAITGPSLSDRTRSLIPVAVAPMIDTRRGRYGANLVWAF